MSDWLHLLRDHWIMGPPKTIICWGFSLMTAICCESFLFRWQPSWCVMAWYRRPLCLTSLGFCWLYRQKLLQFALAHFHSVVVHFITLLVLVGGNCQFGREWGQILELTALLTAGAFDVVFAKCGYLLAVALAILPLFLACWCPDVLSGALWIEQSQVGCETPLGGWGSFLRKPNGDWPFISTLVR